MNLKGKRQSKNVIDSRKTGTFANMNRSEAVSKEYQGTNLTDEGQRKSLKKRGAEYQRFKSAVKDMEDDNWVPVNTGTTAPLYGVKSTQVKSPKETQVTPGKWVTKKKGK